MSTAVSDSYAHRAAPLGPFSGNVPSCAPQKLIIIDERALERECLAKSLVAHGLQMEVEAYQSIEACLDFVDLETDSIGLLINLGRASLCDDRLGSGVKRIIQSHSSVPVIILSENGDLKEMLSAFELGVKGYLSSSMGLSVCVGAISLALVGGSFVSADSLGDLRSLLTTAEERQRKRAALFTEREAEVIDALTRGKPNKIIAYELNLRESTVKVHIRSIMKKLNARNRTEAIFKMSGILNS
ncbi:DNA-binding response regulator [Pseudorhizobium endolithicum]|uniref:DNA-binding response regulator n=1 Tax=Pseudorhizobium endolithicum TaxID=1191678 RepID=A0ABN7JWQ1_9HYPH|nr:response regulator transcription factor [Pseudorhizobium endolithicum]CAD7044364.1 DNA-binding response regulator [Pseudorhizobium endolithicum]